MKLATFEVETAAGRKRRVGVKRDGTEQLVDVTSAYAASLAASGEDDPVAVAETHAPSEMRTFLERGDRALGAAREALEHAEDAGGDERGLEGGRLVFSLDDVDLLPPLPRPNTLRDFMVFEEHVRNSMGEDPPDVWYDIPIYYKGNPNPDVTYGPGDEVPYPDYSESLDYELEVAVVIGKKGREISADEAEDYIAGYTVFNDFSARDKQLEEMQGRLGPAKGKDFANAFGPSLVTPDSFEVEAAGMTAEVNGDTWSEGTVGEMYHPFADIIEYVSGNETLYPGDVLGSGTVGEGCGLELGRFLNEGDTVALTVEGIGTLENTVV
ncbi:MAG: fumarylacetoacetate hydrolase family protein [Halobacteriales archaeon]|nr:fumarylacetoacetate hydrolase family protein [Halobacteriales archaeon]